MQVSWSILWAIPFSMSFSISATLAQTETRPSDVVPRSPLPNLPFTTPNQVLPPADSLLAPIAPTTNPKTDHSGQPFIVKEFQVIGSTVFSTAELNEIVQPFTNRTITFADLLLVRAAIADLYVRNGYITSGAFVPPQETSNGIVTIQVIEGQIEEIKISGNQRLHPDYIRARLNVATGKPVNRDRLLHALQLLQLNPLLSSISADLKVGTKFGSNILDVNLTEANSFNARVSLDNYEAPSVGQFRRQIEISEGNLLGYGDTITALYSNTEGRSAYGLSYTLPINPYNGSININFNNANSNIIDPIFKPIDIYSNSTNYDLTFRQPLIQSTSQEFALGITGSYREGFTTLLKLPIPLSAGADNRGKTSISALRFFQDFTQRSSQDIFALRSQLSLGLGGVLGSTINSTGADSRFVSWRGQAQYVRSVAPDTLLILNASMQFSDRALPSAEQFGVGGARNGRGYAQDTLIGDNGINASVELRLPIMRVAEAKQLLQITTFIDLGTVWNQPSSPNLDRNWLMGTGIGLLWQVNNHLTARLDYGIPLISVRGNRNSWQENGIYFSLSYNLF